MHSVNTLYCHTLIYITVVFPVEITVVNFSYNSSMKYINEEQIQHKFQ